jgi:hypothetical protein
MSTAGVIEAEPRGLVNCPIAFQPDGQQPLEGATFHTDPNGVMAKCPSKYEAAKSAARIGS